MEDKVSVNVREIENGYLVDRSWCEKKEGKDGDMKYDYKNETYYLASLPPLLEKMFSKKKNAEDFGGKKPGGKDEFEEAIDEMDKEAQDEEDSESPEEEAGEKERGEE